MPKNTMGYIILYYLILSSIAFKGKARLDDATEPWQMATEENKGELRFFRVEVELP